MIKNIPVPIFKTIQRYRQDWDCAYAAMRQTLLSCDPNSADLRQSFFMEREGCRVANRQETLRTPIKAPHGTLVRKEKGIAIFPGFCDVHVHFREPGFSYKETMVTGSRAAARGGYTAVCAMPNLNPVPDSLAHLKEEEDLIAAAGGVVDILPYAALTVGEKGAEPAALEALAPRVVAFSDDGKGVQSESMMRSLMERCRKLGKVLAAHCEDEALVRGGYIHDGAYAAAHGHRGICSESEWGPIARDLKLAKETGCAYHVCHISCKESATLIRQAKKDGVNVTCETGPHYLLLDDSDLQEDGRFRMNPPLRAKEDREALVEALLDGTIDMIATDHGPRPPQRGRKEPRAGGQRLRGGRTGMHFPGALYRAGEDRDPAAGKADRKDGHRAAGTLRDPAEGRRPVRMGPGSAV